MTGTQLIGEESVEPGQVKGLQTLFLGACNWFVEQSAVSQALCAANDRRIQTHLICMLLTAPLGWQIEKLLVLSN